MSPGVSAIRAASPHGAESRSSGAPRQMVNDSRALTRSDGFPPPDRGEPVARRGYCGPRSHPPGHGAQQRPPRRHGPHRGWPFGVSPPDTSSSTGPTRSSSSLSCTHQPYCGPAVEPERRQQPRILDHPFCAQITIRSRAVAGRTRRPPIDKLCSAGGRSGPRPAPVLAAITLVGRCRRRAAVDAVPASGAVGRVHEGTLVTIVGVPTQRS